MVTRSNLLESVWLDARDELHRRGAYLVAQESIDVERHRGVDAIHRRQGPEAHSMPPQEATRFEDRLAARRPVPRAPVEVVQVPGPIDAQAHEEPVLAE